MVKCYINEGLEVFQRKLGSIKVIIFVCKLMMVKCHHIFDCILIEVNYKEAQDTFVVGWLINFMTYQLFRGYLMLISGFFANNYIVSSK